jgi:hypothetical protein
MCEREITFVLMNRSNVLWKTHPDEEEVPHSHWIPLRKCRYRTLMACRDACLCIHFGQMLFFLPPEEALLWAVTLSATNGDLMYIHTNVIHHSSPTNRKPNMHLH